MEVDGWTIEMLKQHLEQMIRATEQRLLDLIAAETQLRIARREDDLRAIDKAETAMTRRLDSMNELREQLNHQDKTFITISTFRAELDKVTTEIERNRNEIERTRDLALPRETYETALRDWTTWRSTTEKFLMQRLGTERGISATGKFLASLLAAGVAILTIVVILADHFTK